MVKIKICGITSLDDARAAIEAGVEMLGFNFYRLSPRFIEPDTAHQIIDSLKSEYEPRQIETIGIFVNEPIADVLNAIRVSGVDGVQLHGDESPAYCNELKSSLSNQTVIKALRVRAAFEPREAGNYDVDAIMLDAFHDQLRGGTGRVINWDVARATREIVPRLFLSGGLSPENVAEAIARVQPYAIDACSSLESAPGRKDAARMKAFVRAARNG
jgi:phosphoribosylanthranilate isomerase